MGTVRIYETRFLEDDIWEGDYPRDDVTESVYDGLTARDAADLIDSHGLSFAATGNDWAADPDGTYISNYERVEKTAHLSGFPDRVVNAIIESVG